MTDDIARRLVADVTEAGLGGAEEPELLRLFCEGALAAGVPLRRGSVLVDTLHPIYEGRMFRWSREAGSAPTAPYGRSADDPNVDTLWRASPFHRLAEAGEAVLRRDLRSVDAAEFPLLGQLREEGNTDYLAMLHRFGAERTIGEMDGVYSSWCTDVPEGFTGGQIGALERAMPSLALAIKAASLTRIADTLAQTYLGRDAGRRVMAGRIARGVAERIFAALWFSDLRGFTAITDSCPPEAVIPLLNDYADAIVSSIHEAGGDVLKLIGDGTLAIFADPDPGKACRCALEAEGLARGRAVALNARRAAEGQPWTEAYVGLHVGEVFYGNIGSEDRLDFTVVGPAVNEASRIATMCRSAERPVLLSSAFRAAAYPEDQARLVSVGRYALRGIERPQELFTLDRP